MSKSNPLDDIRHLIAIHSGKGGVGKSTVTVNLAVSLARTGARVGILDADVHGPSTALMMGNEDWPDPGKQENSIFPLEAHGVKFISMGNLATDKTPLIWRGAMVHGVLQQLLNNVLWGELDYLLIDMPPGTGDALISLSQLVSLTGVVAVSTPQELSLADTIRGLRAFEKLEVPILGIIENMSYFICDDCLDRAYLFGESGVAILADELGFALLGRLPIETAVCDAGDEGQPFVLSQPESASAKAMINITNLLLQKLESLNPSKGFHLEWQTMNWDQRHPQPPSSQKALDSMIRAVWQVSQDELGIQWQDGSADIFSARELRLACPCAACVEEMTGKPLLDPQSIAGDMGFKKIKSVGRYAINPLFSDGHQSGIFHFQTLRSKALDKTKS